jgi:ribosomal protein S18 acetylase RimI-like enzyme
MAGVIRPVDAADVPFLEAMLVEAVHWRAVGRRLALEETIAEPQVRRYLEGWGRPGDAGVVSVDDDRRLGAAWYRLFTRDQPGYGFVNEVTPELTVAVVGDARGKGIGTALLDTLLERGRQVGFEAISLSVEPDNPAVRLYERAGFTRVGGSGAWTMLAEL